MPVNDHVNQQLVTSFNRGELVNSALFSQLINSELRGRIESVTAEITVSY